MKRVPHPPHPRRRRKPLPRANPPKTLLDSPSYREAEEDLEYRKHDDNRGVRLLLEYQKVESILQRERIAHIADPLSNTYQHRPVVDHQAVGVLSWDILSG